MYLWRSSTSNYRIINANTTAEMVMIENYAKIIIFYCLIDVKLALANQLTMQYALLKILFVFRVAVCCLSNKR
jgi:hypothetical protein